MRKLKKAIIGVLASAMLMGAMTGCGKAASDDITVISREDGSGTRGAFIELFGIEEKDADGNKIDNTISTADITNSTSVMMTSVADDEAAIGYISLGSLDDSVKALKIDGAEATADNISNGSYKVSRPFNIATKGTPNEVTQDFINFILSEDGQKVVEDAGYISQGNAGAFKAAGVKGKINIAGSSSVTPVMEKLKEAYVAVNPDVQIEVQQSDSTTGMTSAAEGVCDIGMASRELKDSELSAGLTPTVIAIDGIAVITDTANTITDIKSEDLAKVYTGEITNWKDLGGPDEQIVVIGREAGSGTRDAFEELMDVKDSCKYAQELDSTGAVLAKVAATPGAVGYVSLDVLDDTVNGLKINSVEPTEDNILAGDYVLQRPFVMASKGEISEQSKQVQAYFDFINSADGQNVIKSVGLIIPNSK